MHRLETDDFRIVPPAEDGSYYLVVDKSNGIAVAEMRYIRTAPTYRRWRVRPYGAPETASWTYCAKSMEAAQYGFNNFRTP